MRFLIGIMEVWDFFKRRCAARRKKALDGHVLRLFHKTAMTLVRIRLNLNQTGRAESTIEVPRAGTFDTAAYATHAELRNVRPVIETDKQRRIATVAGTCKSPCAYLEGELVAWSGRLRDKADEARKDAIRDVQVPAEASATKYHAARATINFNPKKASVFYDTANPERTFEGADRLVVTGWDYGVEGAAFRAMDATEKVANPLAPSAFERREIPRGRRATAATIKQEGRTP